MQLKAVPQNLLEWAALKTNQVPLPLAFTQIGFVFSHAIMDAAEAGIFEALENENLSVEKIAEKCALNKYALESLLGVLVSAGYLHYHSNKFSLTKISRKWLLRSSPDNVCDLNNFNTAVCWDWMHEMKNFLRSGRGLQYHNTFNETEWELYQKAMYNAAASSAGEVSRTTPMPPNPLLMLDIGGSHGAYSVALCRRYPTLHSIILDLPQAIEKAAPILSKQGMENKVQYLAGNALTENFGENKYDLILMASLAHHFTAEENKDIARRAAHALKPGGIFIIQEFIRQKISPSANMIGSVLNLFFALSSTSGTWSTEEIKSWQTAAGLQFKKAIKFITVPGTAQIVACKRK